jgi:hypothetical protein
MCPLCLTTAALIAVSVTSSGGLAALAIRKFGMKHVPGNNTPDRRNEDVNHD